MGGPDLFKFSGRDCEIFSLPSTGTALETVEAKAMLMAKTFNVNTAAEAIADALIQVTKVASVIYVTNEIKVPRLLDRSTSRRP